MLGLDFVKKIDNDWEKRITRLYVEHYNENYNQNYSDNTNY